MERNVECYMCNKHVGIIRDAKLMKGLSYICPSCKSLIEMQLMSMNKSSMDKVMSIFDGFNFNRQ